MFKIIYVSLLFLSFFPQYAFAGGAVARQNQMKQMQEQQIYKQQMAIKEAQKKAYEEAVRKRMMEYLAAKRAAEQKRAYEQAVYQKMYKKKMAEKIAYEKAMKAAMQKKMAQAVVQQKIQQTVIYQKQIQEKAKLEYQLAMADGKQKQELMRQYQARQQAGANPQLPNQSHVLQSGRRMPSRGALSQDAQTSPSRKKKKNEEIVDISQVWERLETDSEVWSLMIDREPKELTVQREIDQFKAEGVIIKKSAAYYTDRIDRLLTQNAEMKQYPLKNILRILAVMDYDFNNGQNRDLMAMEVLGAELYLENKKRPGLLDDVY